MNATAKSVSIDTHVLPADALAQGARRATEASASAGASPTDPEVVALAERRQFSSAQKRRIVGEAARCTEPGQIGALLRRERIYSSMLTKWRRQIDATEQAALAPQRRGPKPDLAARQIQRLNQDNARLRLKLERAELIIAAQKKLCIALDLLSEDASSATD